MTCWQHRSIFKVIDIVTKITANRSNPLKRTAAGGLIYYRHEAWPQLRHGIFTRHGGISASPWDSLNLGASVGDSPASVAENRRRLLAGFGLEAAPLGTLWLVHGKEVLRLDEAPRSNNGNLPKGDALITDRPGLPLLLRFADCLPLLLYDPERAAIGIVHAGWRGTAFGIAAAAIHALQEAYGCEPAAIQALIGPGICGDCYEVGDEVRRAMGARFGAAALATISRPAPNGSWLLDLAAANQLELRNAGVEIIHNQAPCTACHPEDFFSHRAEKGRTGRFGALICL